MDSDYVFLARDTREWRNGECPPPFNDTLQFQELYHHRGKRALAPHRVENIRRIAYKKQLHFPTLYSIISLNGNTFNGFHFDVDIIIGRESTDQVCHKSYNQRKIRWFLSCSRVDSILYRPMANKLL